MSHSSDTSSNNNKDDHAAQGFSESWLSLREPADHAARSQCLSNRLGVWARQYDTLNVVELGAGTGSNLRYLMPQLGHDQHWILIDNDATLLDHLPRLLQPWADEQNARITVQSAELRIEHEHFSATVSSQVMDLALQLERLPLNNANLLTASALLDLTSAKWLDRLAAQCTEHECACLFVLNYNGKIEWHPENQTDRTITSLLNQHQLKNKGFGKALGPAAGQYFANALIQRGRHVDTADSDWAINGQLQALQHAIIDGWAPAALDQDGNFGQTIADWHAARRMAIERGDSSLTVGHLDVLSLE